MIEEVEFNQELIVSKEKNGWCIVRLNRPNVLHALNLALIQQLMLVLKTIEIDETVKAIWLDSTTPKAFCAGEDIREIRQFLLQDSALKISQFFKEEYQLNLLLHQYKKPIVIWGEGYVMGGGLGLFITAPFRLVTQYSRLSMPEINIGLYPAVGATRFLAERGSVGLFAGLTGAMLTSSGAYAMGLANYVCETNKDIILNNVLSINFEKLNAYQVARLISEHLNTFHRPLPAGALQMSLDSVYEVCQGQSFEADYAAILNLKDVRSDWLRQASKNLQKGSPTSAALTWLLWKWAQTPRSWEQVFELETQLSIWQVKQPDFLEGVRAHLIDKDLLPVWKKPHTYSLVGILCDNPPITTLDSWNQLLKHYHVIN